MTALQKITLGTPPLGVDGDPVRTGFDKSNSNIDVFNSQATLTSAPGITAAQALTVAHVGKRINIALAAAGVINLPAASTCAADNVLLLRNQGTTVVTLAITVGSGDTVALSKLNPGETALMDTDGVHAWTVLMRGRTSSDNEVVNGNCTVNGNETVGGTMGVTGATTLTGLTVNGPTNINGNLNVAYPQNTASVASYSDTAGEVVIEATKTGVSATKYNLNIGKYGGAVLFGSRPTFAGNTPWDSGNLAGSVTAGVFNFTNRPKFFGATPWDNSNLPAPVTTSSAHVVNLPFRTVGSAGALGLVVDGSDQGNLVSGGTHAVVFNWTGAQLNLYVDGSYVGKVTTA